MTEYADDTLVYVDPNTRAVVGAVEWLPNGKPKKVAMPEPAEKEGQKKDRPRIRKKERYYPWCSYRTAKRVYRVAGKQQEEPHNQTFDSALQKALEVPYWD